MQTPEMSYTSRFSGYSPQGIPDLTRLDQILAHYEQHGFSIFRFHKSNTGCGGDQDPRLVMDFLREAFRLGPSFVSNFNQSNFNKNYQDAYNYIGQVAAGGKHEVFDTDSAQRLHCDGTFEPIGIVKTSVLLVIQEAASGGDTLLFDAISAFKHLQSTTPELAQALLDSSALRRASTIGTNDESIGPAFAYSLGEIITRFTDDQTSDWSYGFSRVPRLEEAVRAMRELAQPGSVYFLQTPVRSGHGIIFANDTLAHGRQSFSDDPLCPRTLLRGLFRCRPSLASFVRRESTAGQSC
jgi:Taurine catabolism dioxygenase TauD, TfdA family